MTTIIEETCTITAKGQTTVPKAVRQALGVDYGGKITYRVEDGHVTVLNPAGEHHDPALLAYLGLIEKDIARNGNVRDLPPAMVKAMKRAIRDVHVDLDQPLEGETAL